MLIFTILSSPYLIDQCNKESGVKLISAKILIDYYLNEIIAS